MPNQINDQNVTDWQKVVFSDESRFVLGTDDNRCCSATLGSIPIRRFCVQKTCSGRPRATTPAEDRFLALSARRRRTTTVPQLVADHFQASGRRISRYYGAKSSSQCRSVCKKTSCVRSLNGRQRRNRLCWASEHVSWTQQQWASELFTDESRFTMESDSGRLLIWREQRTRYHQSNTVERHSYRGGGILVWAGSRSVATLTCMCSMEEP
ncbi:HTH_Tnp_Tc3_2 domain-containing protein [Trichonephila clavipes]|nr:HTH_Tnp_Tc3_2 domain-containing protein [Trichonephila clavipes]